jgi:hypothetical protein
MSITSALAEGVVRVKPTTATAARGRMVLMRRFVFIVVLFLIARKSLFQL